MNAKQQGFLLLTSHLGDPACKPLTVAQFRTLANRVRGVERPTETRELTRKDLLDLGYDGVFAENILFLLSRQVQLEYYVNRAAKAGCYPITRICDQYPRRLRNRLGLDSPGCLWLKGDPSLLLCAAISVVGSRELCQHNRQFATEAGLQAAKQGFVLVSGNAKGADRAAQDACLQQEGKVVSVIADKLLDQPADPNVLYISEDGFDLEFSPQRAISRNHIIHALGELVLVAQCSLEKGGTWNGTVYNLRHGLSPVFCFHDGSQSIDALQQMGADVILPNDLKNISALKPKNRSLFDM